MNKDNAKDYLPLVQALAEGKVIQWRNHAGSWEDSDELSDAWTPDHYRIKPEPREIFVVNEDDDLAYFDESRARATALDTFKIVRYREVIE